MRIQHSSRPSSSSSAVRSRCDETILVHGAVDFKNEVKNDDGALESHVVQLELLGKLNADIGLITFPYKICFNSIDYDVSSSSYSSTLFKTFDVRFLAERVSFLQDIVKIAEWMSTIRDQINRCIWFQICGLDTSSQHKELKSNNISGKEMKALL